MTEARLLGEFGLHPNFALQGVLPFRIIGTNTRYTDLAGNPTQLDYENIHHHNHTLAGLGDAQLFLHGAMKLGDFQLGGAPGDESSDGQGKPEPVQARR